MSLRSLINLESGVVDSQFLRNRSDVANFHDILRFVQEQTSSKLTEELAREIHSFDRKERQALLLKQSIFIDNLRQELERAYMSMEDGILKSVTYREKRLRYMTKVMSLLQERETKVCNYGHKLMERAEEFAKRFVIETLDWRRAQPEDIAWNHEMWQLHSQVAKNLGTAPSTSGAYLPIDVDKFSQNVGEELLKEDFEWYPGESLEFDDKTGQPIPNRSLWNLSLGLLKLIRVLQAIEMSCSSGQICDGTDKNAASSSESFRIVGHALKILDKIVLADGEDANVYISTIFKALSSLLHSPMYVNAHTSTTSNGESKKEGTGWSWGEDFSDDALHQRLLYWIRTVHHCRSFYVQKLGIFPAISLQDFSLGTASLDEIVDEAPSIMQGDNLEAKPSGYTFATFNRNEYQDIFLVGDHNGLFSLGSQTVVNILRSVNASLQAAYSHCKSHELLSPSMKELVNASLKFCENAISSYNFRLEGAEGYNFDDVALIEAVEGEIFECIRVATTALNNGFLNEDLIRIIKGVITLTRKRSTNFFLATVMLQCLQSALYCYVHQRNLPASRQYEQDIKEKKRKQDLVRIPYADLRDMISPNWANLVFHITALHPNSLTIQHVGLVTLRLLLRSPFMTRSNIQDLFEDDEEEEEEDEQEEEQGEEEEDTSNGNEFKKWQTNLWKTEVFEKVNEVFGYPKAGWSLTAMIFFCGESHMQSVEVVEQVLLLVQHLAQVSFLCRITLSERDIEKILNRITEAMPHHVYLMALVEMVHETLAWTD